MKKLTIFQILTICLLGLNLALIGFMIINKPPRHDQGKREGMAKEALHLSDTQSEQFKTFAEAHHKNMEVIDLAQKDILTNYFKQIETENQDESESLLNQYAEKEKERLRLIFTHFKDLKSMLTENQHEYLYAFIDKILNEVILGGSNPPPPQRR